MLIFKEIIYEVILTARNKFVKSNNQTVIRSDVHSASVRSIEQVAPVQAIDLVRSDYSDYVYRWCKDMAVVLPPWYIY